MRKTMKPVYLVQGLILGAMITLAQIAVADSTAMSDDGPAHKLVIQVSSADPVTHKIALNNAKLNLRTLLNLNSTIDINTDGLLFSLEKYKFTCIQVHYFRDKTLDD